MQNLVREYSEPRQPSFIFRLSLSLNKRLLGIYWKVKGQIHYKLLKQKESLDFEMQCWQMDDVNKVLKENIPVLVNKKKIMLHHDNTKSDGALATRQRYIRKFCHTIILPRPTTTRLSCFFSSKNPNMKQMSTKHSLSFSPPRIGCSIWMEFTNYHHVRN